MVVVVVVVETLRLPDPKKGDGGRSRGWWAWSKMNIFDFDGDGFGFAHVESGVDGGATVRGFDRFTRRKIRRRRFLIAQVRLWCVNEAARLCKVGSAVAVQQACRFYSAFLEKKKDGIGMTTGSARLQVVLHVLAVSLSGEQKRSGKSAACLTDNEMQVGLLEYLQRLNIKRDRNVHVTTRRVLERLTQNQSF